MSDAYYTKVRFKRWCTICRRPLASSYSKDRGICGQCEREGKRIKPLRG